MNITHLAPLELVEFSQNFVDCGSFQIRRFSHDELDSIFCNRVRKIFYPGTYIPSEDLEAYWFIYVKENVPARKAGEMRLHLDWRVRPSYSPHPPVVQDAVKSLALYNWGSYPSHLGKRGLPGNKYESDEQPLLPLIPFVISIADSLIEWPRNSPDLSGLLTERFGDPQTGGDVPLREYTMGADETESFARFNREMSSLFSQLNAHAPQWDFEKLALDFLLKAFITRDLEQLLWHITAIEAVLGEKFDSGLTRRLRNRISTALGSTEEERKGISRQFKQLYEVRSDLVHGNPELTHNEIHLAQLSEARDLARGIVLWMLRFLGHIAKGVTNAEGKVPRKEDLLGILDMDSESRKITADVIRTLPVDFPNVRGWLE